MVFPITPITSRSVSNFSIYDWVVPKMEVPSIIDDHDLVLQQPWWLDPRLVGCIPHIVGYFMLFPIIIPLNPMKISHSYDIHIPYKNAIQGRFKSPKMTSPWHRRTRWLSLTRRESGRQAATALRGRPDVLHHGAGWWQGAGVRPGRGAGRSEDGSLD